MEQSTHPNPTTKANSEPPAAKGERYWSMPYDLSETPTEIVIYADVPGVDEDEINVERHGAGLLICANRDFDHDHEDAEDYTILQRLYGQFRCIVRLPKDAYVDGMTAKYRRGVLKVRIPRRNESRGIKL